MNSTLVEKLISLLNTDDFKIFRLETDKEDCESSIVLIGEDVAYCIDNINEIGVVVNEVKPAPDYIVGSILRRLGHNDFNVSDRKYKWANLIYQHSTIEDAIYASNLNESPIIRSLIDYILTN